MSFLEKALLRKFFQNHTNFLVHLCTIWAEGEVREVKMEKKIADALIHEYVQKIYGFAVSRAFNLQEAEELSSDIVFEVYTSLLKLHDLHNPAGYIWRISENVYSRYVMGKKREEHASLDDVTIPTYDEYEFEDESVEAQCALLRREIAYLTRTRREVIMAFYFEKKKAAEIAESLSLPEGTVKWHLSRAKDELKEGMKMERNIGELGLAPMRFVDMGHNGRPGKNGGPEAYISGLIEQNVVYAVYFEPKTINEISDELGISPVYLEDVVNKLAENGFLVPVGKGKYTTYISIAPANYSMEKLEADYKRELEIIELLKKEYIPQVKAYADTVKDVYIPNGNSDLLFATLCTYGIMTQNRAYGEEIAISKYFIQPTDGGSYIAYAYPKQQCSDPNYKSTIEIKRYSCCGPMTREGDKYGNRVASWAIDSDLDTREGYWQNNCMEDYEYLYEFICGKLSKGEENAEKYQRLYERKFLGEGDRVQVIVVDNDALNDLPQFSDELKEKLATYAGKAYELIKSNYPPQMQDLIRDQSRYVLMSSMPMAIIDSMIADGTLPNFTDVQRVALNLIVFSDTLPE